MNLTKKEKPTIENNQMNQVDLDIKKSSEKLLEIINLKTNFYTEEGVVKAVDGVSFDIYEDEVLGLVGETGCGKSVTALSILRLVRAPGKIIDGVIRFKNINLLDLTEDQMREYRGNSITMIFQDPLNSLNPVLSVGKQISEVFLLHQKEELKEILDTRLSERKKKLQEIEDLKIELEPFLTTTLPTITFSSICGFILAMIAGLFGGWIDFEILRIMDVLLAFLGLSLVLVFAAIWYQNKILINKGEKSYLNDIAIEKSEETIRGVEISDHNGISKRFTEKLSVNTTFLSLTLPTIIFSTIVGIVFGVITGFFGGWVDFEILRILNILIVFPGMILGLVFILIWKQKPRLTKEEIVNLKLKLGELKTKISRKPKLTDILWEKSEEIIREVGIPDAKGILKRYPHELSGGMRQRIMISMALSCNPKLLIADEPTTALDVTIQAQILDLMKNLKKKFQTSILMITHDLGIIAELCDRIAVMYSGSIVEYATTIELFKNPRHPYTKGLMGAIPSIEKKNQKLQTIRGMVPNLIYPPDGCRFHPRCDYRLEICDKVRPKWIEIDNKYFIACHLFDPDYKSSPKYQWSETATKESYKV